MSESRPQSRFVRNKGFMTVAEAEVLLGTLAVDALQGDFEELKAWAKEAPISLVFGEPIVNIAPNAPASENRTQIPAGFKLVPDQPVMWRREWDGDVSDEGQWVYAATREELDEYGPWEPLYSEQGPL